MSTCTTCYGTNTAQPCASVGCLSTNYAKCITYSGANLFCQQGSIATFTFTGVAVSSPVDVTVTASVTGGNGTDATFIVVRKAGQTTYQVTLENEGAGYEISDVLTIPGNLLGGAAPANNISITITGLTPVIATGSNLDSVIANLNNRLCLVSEESPSGLDYTAFNYQCLRVGGNLESVGTPITTAQGFTEAVAAALCSLNTRVKALEVPQIIVDSYFGGSLTSGTSTLIQILNKYGEAIGDINDKFTINSPHTCNTFTHLTNLTAKPSPTASLGTWFDWVSTNLCNNFTILDAKITEQNTEHALINTFLYGINQPYPVSRGNNFVDTSCLPGGSATSNIRTAVNLLSSQLCSLKSTVNGLSNPTYTLGWSSCFSGIYPTNSLWGVQNTVANGLPLSGFVNTTTLQTHLNQIVKVLSNLNLKFSSDFQIDREPCGPIIGLAPGAAFSCSALNTCSINNLGDVNISSPVLNGDSLTFSTGSNTWVNRSVNVLINGSNSNVTKSVTGTSLTYDLNISAAVSGSTYHFVGVPNPLTYGIWRFEPSLKYPITKTGANGMFYGVSTPPVLHVMGGFRIVTLGITSWPIADFWYNIPTSINNINPLRLESEILVPVILEVITPSTGVITATHHGVVKIYSASTFVLGFSIKANTTFSISPNDVIEVIMPTITCTIS